MKRRGFTLIELLVVIAIIGILATMVFINLSGATTKAKVSKAVAAVTEIKKAVDLYNVQTSSWPNSYYAGASLDLNGITAASIETQGYNNDLTTEPTSDSVPATVRDRWMGPYMDQWPRHPWGGFIDLRYNKGNSGPCNDMQIVLNDDSDDNTTHNDTPIPLSVMILIDKALDDGNLASGKVRDSANTVTVDGTEQVITVEGEVIIGYKDLQDGGIVQNCRIGRAVQ